MANMYCKKFFYPEKHQDMCELMRLSTGICNIPNTRCQYQLHLNAEEHAILDNLRIIKQQNAEILWELRGPSKAK